VVHRPKPEVVCHLGPWRPSGYITLGLLGTFVGVAFSLAEGDFTRKLSEIQIVNVLKAASIAFDKSVIGVSASIIASIGNRFASERKEEDQERQALLSIIDNLAGFRKSSSNSISSLSTFKVILEHFGRRLRGVLEQNKSFLDRFHAALLRCWIKRARC